jgi:hypothetical protein
MKIELRAIPDGEEHESACSCCGRSIYAGCGELHTNARVIADYWYRWPEGHQGRFTMAVAIRDAAGEPIENGGVVALSARIDSENIVYSVLAPEDSPWSDFGAYGPVIDRDRALEASNSSGLFNIVDAISANERRLSSRILACGLKA